MNTNRRKLHARLFSFSMFFAGWAVIAALLPMEWRILWTLVTAISLILVGFIYLVVEVSWRIEHGR